MVGILVPSKSFSLNFRRLNGKQLHLTEINNKPELRLNKLSYPRFYTRLNIKSSNDIMVSYKDPWVNTFSRNRGSENGKN